MDLSTERASRRGSYFAHFAEEGKELETQFERSSRSDGFPAVMVRATAAQAVIPWRSCVISSATRIRRGFSAEFGYYGWGTWVGQWQRE
jgi:hypothetical protein